MTRSVGVRKIVMRSSGRFCSISTQAFEPQCIFFAEGELLPLGERMRLGAADTRACVWPESMAAGDLAISGRRTNGARMAGKPRSTAKFMRAEIVRRRWSAYSLRDSDRAVGHIGRCCGEWGAAGEEPAAISVEK